MPLSKSYAMRVPDKFKEYIWLVNAIWRAGRITLDELQTQWLRTTMSEGVELSRSTFCRHRSDIEDIFGIYIDCDRRHGYKYFIANEHVLREDTVQNWLLSTLSVGNLVSESLALQDRILLEPIPYVGDLQTFIEAMRQQVCVDVTYRKYGSDTPSHYCLAPYCVKMFRQRWYVLGHFHLEASNGKPAREHLGVFAFDRMLKATLTTRAFTLAADFDGKTFFSQCFGVLVNDHVPEQRIVIRAYGRQRFYLRDLPLHASQQEVGQGEDYTDFALLLRPTADFVAHLMSLGDSVKVLSPASLAEEMKAKLMRSLALYSD